MNEFLTREEERKQERKVARAADPDEMRRLAAEASELRDGLREYLRMKRYADTQVEADRETVILTSGRMELHVMVRPDDRYSLEQKGGGLLDNVRMSITKVQLHRKDMIDVVLDWLASSEHARPIDAVS
jgi:hypothetical protein